MKLTPKALVLLRTLQPPPSLRRDGEPSRRGAQIVQERKGANSSRRLPYSVSSSNCKSDSPVFDLPSACVTSIGIK